MQAAQASASQASHLTRTRDEARQAASDAQRAAAHQLAGCSEQLALLDLAAQLRRDTEAAQAAAAAAAAAAVDRPRHTREALCQLQTTVERAKAAMTLPALRAQVGPVLPVICAWSMMHFTSGNVGYTCLSCASNAAGCGVMRLLPLFDILCVRMWYVHMCATQVARLSQQVSDLESDTSVQIGEAAARTDPSQPALATRAALAVAMARLAHQEACTQVRAWLRVLQVLHRYCTRADDHAPTQLCLQRKESELLYVVLLCAVLHHHCLRAHRDSMSCLARTPEHTGTLMPMQPHTCFFCMHCDCDDMQLGSVARHAVPVRACRWLCLTSLSI